MFRFSVRGVQRSCRRRTDRREFHWVCRNTRCGRTRASRQIPGALAAAPIRRALAWI